MSTTIEDMKHAAKRANTKAKREEKKDLDNQKRLIQLDVKKKGGSKEEVALRMAALQLESAKRLAEQSKQQIAEQFTCFDELVNTQAKDMLDLVRDVPTEIVLPENISSELTRLTNMLSDLKNKRNTLYQTFQAIDTSSPLSANSELLDIAGELTSMQMDIAAVLLPAAMDLYNLAPKELAKLKEKGSVTK